MKVEEESLNKASCYLQLLIRLNLRISQFEYDYNNRHNKIYPRLYLNYPARIELLKKAKFRIKDRYNALLFKSVL